MLRPGRRRPPSSSSPSQSQGIASLMERRRSPDNRRIGCPTEERNNGAKACSCALRCPCLSCAPWSAPEPEKADLGLLVTVRELQRCRLTAWSPNSPASAWPRWRDLHGDLHGRPTCNRRRRRNAKHNPCYDPGKAYCSHVAFRHFVWLSRSILPF